jgi:hypothetical protein
MLAFFRRTLIYSLPIRLYKTAHCMGMCDIPFELLRNTLDLEILEILAHLFFFLMLGIDPRALRIMATTPALGPFLAQFSLLLNSDLPDLSFTVWWLLS